MSAILDGFCDLFLRVASILWLVAGYLWLVSQQGAAADRAGSGVVFGFPCAACWLCVSFVLIRIASQGAFTASHEGSRGAPLLGLADGRWGRSVKAEASTLLTPRQCLRR